jgi:hypothetical protein
MFSPVAHRQAWEANVLFLASPATWTQDGTPLALRAGFAVGRETDVAIANALGVGVRKVTIRAIDTAGRAPRVFDRLEIAGESLSIDAVVPVVFAGELYGWRCSCAGQGLTP